MAMSTPTYPTLPGGHALSPFRAQALLQKLQAIDDAIETLDAEWFYPLEVSAPGPDGALAGERLARLQLRTDSIVWDIGAGSGSVGLEAARLCHRGHVWAIEKNAHDVEIIRQNHDAFRVANYTLVHDKAPAGMEAWPDPDAVFIGGSGGELAELIRLVLSRLKPSGHLVMNFVTLENLATALETLKDVQSQSVGAKLPADDSVSNDMGSPAASRSGKTLHWDVLQLQASRSRPILSMNRLAAENPVWLVSACWRDVKTDAM